MTLTGTKDLNEPMHLVFINSTDKFYLDGVLYTGQEIRDDINLRNRVDLDGDGAINEIGPPTYEPFIDPFGFKLGIGFAAKDASSYTWYYDPLEPGTYGRLIILTEG